MRKLSKKVTAAFVCGLLAVFLFTGCGSAYQTNGSTEVKTINGWELSSFEGNDAIRACSAQEVTAQKYQEIDGAVELVSIF